jgi:uncharacterized surface protein with fasciclin (FAS1) repeats
MEDQPRERTDVMKPPRPTGSDTTAAESQLVELSTALKAGRLVALLKGEGLTRNTVEELLRPGSAAKLRVILTDHLVTHEVTRGPDPGHAPGRFPTKGGKVLVFKARVPSRP